MLPQSVGREAKVRRLRTQYHKHSSSFDVGLIGRHISSFRGFLPTSIGVLLCFTAFLRVATPLLLLLRSCSGLDVSKVPLSLRAHRASTFLNWRQRDGSYSSAICSRAPRHFIKRGTTPGADAVPRSSVVVAFASASSSRTEKEEEENDASSSFQTTRNKEGTSDDADASTNAETSQNRRTFLQQTIQVSASSAAAAPLLLLLRASSPSIADSSFTSGNDDFLNGFTTEKDAHPNFDCLLDLPPIPSDHIRIYLCRHGQTENNRLRLVQGARVNPYLNGMGKKMAVRLGMALSSLYHVDDYSDTALGGDNSQVGVENNRAPAVVAHSSLARARETAELALWTVNRAKHTSRDCAGSLVGKASADDDDGNILRCYTGETEIKDYNRMNFLGKYRGKDKQPTQRNKLRLEELSSLGEVDFGPLAEGEKVSKVRTGMVRTYGAWSVGLIDRRPDGGGESGREVLDRISRALHSLSDVAVSNGGSVVAVSHSTYMRLLLAAALDMPLAVAATLEQKNCCINILDVNVKGDTKTLGAKCNMLGGNLSQARNFDLCLPQISVIRINETRHLKGLI